jgi:hypothetical protein
VRNFCQPQTKVQARYLDDAGKMQTDLFAEIRFGGISPLFSYSERKRLAIRKPGITKKTTTPRST